MKEDSAAGQRQPQGQAEAETPRIFPINGFLRHPLRRERENSTVPRFTDQMEYRCFHLRTKMVWAIAEEAGQGGHLEKGVCPPCPSKDVHAAAIRLKNRFT